MRIHFSGIGGSGVSAIAGFMRGRGHGVSGSDRAFDGPGARHPLQDVLLDTGIILVPQDGSGIAAGIDLLVASTAVEDSNPEISRARALGIPIKTRPEFLAELTSSMRTIAIAGTSGKSTASGLMAYLMERLGMSPSFIGGGRVKALRPLSPTGGFLAGSSPYLVIEACESDGSIVRYLPLHTAILNLALDHHAIGETAGMFRSLAANTAGAVVINRDDANLSAIGSPRAVGFSISAPSEHRALDVELRPMGSSFTVGGVRYSLSLPGVYNIYNALVCIALLGEMGIAGPEMARHLPGFTGIDRRFDVVLNDGQNIVIDDYAHNPHKIAAFMGAMRELAPGVRYVFQPHGFGPTRLMREGYIEAFSENLRDADHLVLLPIYYVGGTVARDISSLDLFKGIASRGRSVEMAGTHEDAIRGALHWRGRGHAHAVMGARDESLAALARAIARELTNAKARSL